MLGRTGCVNDLFDAPPSLFDHHIDHVMTNSPRQVRMLSSKAQPVGQPNR